MVSTSSNYSVYSVALFGETGVGKSSLINAFHCSANFPNDIPNSRSVFPIPESTDQNGNKVTNCQSVTSECRSYEIVDHVKRERYVLLDTPGLDDTNGTAQDDKNLKNIIDAASRLENLSAILLLLKHTNTRITVSFKNALTRLISIIPRKGLRNIILVATHKAGNSFSGIKKIFNSAININELRDILVFGIQNSTFTILNQLNEVTDVDERQELKNSINSEYRSSIEDLENIKSAIKSFQMFSLKTEMTLLKHNHEKAQLKILEAKNAYVNLLSEKEELDKISKELENGKTSLQSLRVRLKEVLRWELVDVSYHSTICGSCFMKRINSVCHENCGLEYTTYNSSIFRGCICMSVGNYCNVCRCSAESHMHIKKLPRFFEVETTKQLQRTLDSQVNNNTQKEIILKQLNDRITTLNSQITTYSGEIRSSVSAIKNEFPNFNIINQLENSIEMMKKELENERVEKTRDNIRQAINSVSNIIKDLLKTN